MNPTRRGFLALLPALVAGTTTYFDVGASWQRHGGLWFPIKRYGIDIQFSSQDLALTVDEVVERFFARAVETIVDRIDKNVVWRLNDNTRWA